MSFRVRNEQVDALSASAWVEYERRMVEHLLDRFSKQCRARGYTPGVLAELVSRSVTRARGYGVHAAADLQLYLECLALLGPAFDTEHEWAVRILGRAGTAGTAKMESIQEYLIVQLAREASASGEA